MPDRRWQNGALDPCFPAHLREDERLARLLSAARAEIAKLQRAPAQRSFRAAGCMSEEEIARGRAITAGHGLYDQAHDAVRLNRSMSAEMIYLNYIHENLHRAFPQSREEAVRVLTALVDCRVRRAQSAHSAAACDVLEQLTEPSRPYR